MMIRNYATSWLFYQRIHKRCKPDSTKDFITINKLITHSKMFLLTFVIHLALLKIPRSTNFNFNMPMSQLYIIKNMFREPPISILPLSKSSKSAMLSLHTILNRNLGSWEYWSNVKIQLHYQKQSLIRVLSMLQGWNKLITKVKSKLSILSMILLIDVNMMKHYYWQINILQFT